VLVDSYVAGTTMVCTQDRQGASMAMQYALLTGPDRVLVLGFPLNLQARQMVMTRRNPPQSGYVAGERMAGYLGAARRAGFPLERITWLEIDDRFPESAARTMAHLRAELPRGTCLAILAMSDRVALAARQEVATWSGIRLTALVGFDDGSAAEASGLTTVHQNAHLKGELAVRALLDGLRPAPLPVELIVRDT
jgi:DNA-binding LacI/PurR family transcriptional regulator